MDTKVKVELLTQHEHAGVVYHYGDKLELDPDTANWLIQLGKAKKVGPAPRDRG